jgi:hypothetical protein
MLGIAASLAEPFSHLNDGPAIGDYKTRCAFAVSIVGCWSALGSAATRPGRSLINTIFRWRAREWLFRVQLSPCSLLQPTTGVGAFSSLPSIPAKVASPNRRRPLRLGGENWYSCPFPTMPDIFWVVCVRVAKPLSSPGA